MLVLRKINPPNIPLVTKHIITGLAGKCKRTLIGNCLIISTIYQIKCAYDLSKNKHVPSTPEKIVKYAVQNFQKELTARFLIFKRNSQVETFRKKFLIGEVAKICDGDIVLKPLLDDPP